MTALQRFQVPQHVVLQRDAVVDGSLDAILTGITGNRLTLYFETTEVSSLGVGETVKVFGGVPDGFVEVPGEIRPTGFRRQIVVEATTSSVVHQRRAYWRLPLRPKSVVALLRDPSGDFSIPLMITLHNLSGGGLMFTTGVRLDPGDLIRPCLSMDSNEILPVATILASQDDGTDMSEGEPEFGYRAKFVSIREQDRDAIVRFVTTRQQAYIERRRHPRMTSVFPPLLANVQLANGERSKTFVVNVLDLSSGGMMFETERALNPADRVRVYFKPSTPDAMMPVVCVLCMVPNDRPSPLVQYRAFFEEITAQERRYVLKLIRHEKQLYAVPWDADRHSSPRAMV